MRTIHATAPCRINDIGGWTDTRFSRYGAVCSIAVYPGAEVSILIGAYDGIRVALDSYGEIYDMNDQLLKKHHPFIYDAIYRNTTEEDRLSITIGSHMPPGASTGTSAAVIVALIGALREAAEMPFDRYLVAKQARAIETELWYESGIQDQVAAAFGGISFISIPEYPRFEREAVEVSDETKTELSRRLSLWYLGKPHASSEIHAQVIEKLGEMPEENRHIETLRRYAVSAEIALRGGMVESYGIGMTRNTERQSRMHPGLVSMDALCVMDIAKRYGAAGWKVNGAGGDGGTVTVLGSKDDELHADMALALEGVLYKQIPIELADEGLRVWCD